MMSPKDKACYIQHYFSANIPVQKGPCCCCQSPSHVWLLATPWTAARQASLSPTISRSLPKVMSIASVMPSSHLILWRPPLLLPSIFPNIKDFSSESAVCIRWPKYWSFSFSISPSKEYSELISLKINWFDLLAVQGTLRTLSSTAIRRHQFFNAPPSSWSSSYNPTWPLGKTMALTMQTFVSRVISLLFKTLSRFVIAFLPRNKHLLISCLQSPSAVILEPKRGNLSLLLRFPPLYLPRSNGARCHDLSFFNI